MALVLNLPLTGLLIHGSIQTKVTRSSCRSSVGGAGRVNGMGHEDTKGLGGRRWDDPGLRDALHWGHVHGASVSHGDSYSYLFFGYA